MPLQLLRCIFCIAVGSSLPWLVRSLSFSFEDFRSSDLIYYGSANYSRDGKYIDLTHSNATNGTGSPTWNVGKVLYRNSIRVWPASFTTTFTILISNITNNDSDPADGIMFSFTPDDSAPSPDSEGSFMGVYTTATNGNATGIFAVEFDTFKNEWDPDNNHAGVNTVSIKSDFTEELSPHGLRLHSGRPISVKINYDGWSHILAVYAAYTDSNASGYKTIINQSILISDVVNRSSYVGLSSATGLSYETHQILSWNFSSSTLPESSLPAKRIPEAGGHSKTAVIVGCTVGAAAAATIIGLWAWKRSKRRRPAQLLDLPYGPQEFSYRQLSAATRNFSESEMLGSGGFGSVYRGQLDESRVVAVKRIRSATRQAERVFMAELSSIGRLRHRNLVPLRGWCHQSDDLFLVYDYMPNGSLDRHLFSTGNPMPWPRRHHILTGLASALLYLHEEWEQRVIHRDIKPSNILLDSEFNARLGDFGLARLAEHGGTASMQAISTIIAGTVGYVAPECGYTGRASTESDVFSFGIVALEMATGRKVGSDGSLVDTVWKLHGDDKIVEAADPRLHGEYSEEEMRKVLILGLACSHPDPQLRPKIRQVLQMLIDPKEPIVSLPASRPMAIYVVLPPPTFSTDNPLYSVTGNATALGASSSGYSDATSLTSSTLHYGR